MSSIKLQHMASLPVSNATDIKISLVLRGINLLQPQYNHRRKVFSVNEGVIAFSKKVHVFLRHPVYSDIKIHVIHSQR